MFILMFSIDGCMNGATFYISHVHEHSLSSSAIWTSKLRQCKPFCMLPLPLLPVHCSMAALFLCSLHSISFSIVGREWNKREKNSINVKSYAAYVVHLFCNCTWRTISRFYMFSLNSQNTQLSDECHKWRFFFCT